MTLAKYKEKKKHLEAKLSETASNKILIFISAFWFSKFDIKECKNNEVTLISENNIVQLYCSEQSDIKKYVFQLIADLNGKHIDFVQHFDTEKMQFFEQKEISSKSVYKRIIKFVEKYNLK